MRAPWRLEWRLLARDGAALAAGLITALTVSLGVVVGERQSGSQAAVLRGAMRTDSVTMAALADSARLAAEQGIAPGPFSVWASPFFVGYFTPRPAVLPPLPTGLFAAGESVIAPSYRRVTAERLESFIDLEELENPTVLLFGAFDLPFVVVVLLPMMMIALGYGIFARDREGGILPLVLAQPIAVDQLSWCRVAVRTIVVAGAATLSLGGTVIAVRWGKQVPWEGLAWSTVWIWGWTLWWGCLALWSNRASRGMVGTALWLAVAWLVQVVVVPLGLERWAMARHPAPPRTALIAAVRAADTESRVRAPQMVEEYWATHPGLRPVGVDPAKYDFGLWWPMIQREVHRRSRPQIRAYDAAVDAQEAVVARWRWLSPALVVRDAFATLAGNDQRRAREFRDAVYAFHEAHRAWFEPRAMGKQRLAPEDYARMPSFRFADASSATRRTVFAVAAALLWGLAAATWGIARRVPLEVV